MHWRTAVGVLARPVVNEVIRRHLLELAMAAEVRECISARLLEYCHVQVSLRSIRGTYWSWQWQLRRGSALAHGCWSTRTSKCQ